MAQIIALSLLDNRSGRQLLRHKSQLLHASELLLAFNEEIIKKPSGFESRKEMIPAGGYKSKVT